MCALMCVYANAAELYTVWNNNTYTLTFYYDNNRTSRTGDDVVLIKPGTNYWAQYGTLVDKIVMDASIKNYQPTTLKEFFQNPSYTIWLRNVRSITNLSYLNTANATTMERMFENMMSLKSVDLSKFNTTNVTSMYRMFANCMALNEVNLTPFNASKVTTTGGMFSGCEKLNSITWGDVFKTNNIEYANEMFYGCKNLYSMDLSRFNLTKNKSFYAMFSGCQTLTTVDFGTYKHTAAQNYNDLFKDCSSLHHINLDNFVFTNITSTSGIFMMFANCSSLQTITCSQDLTAMPNIANTTHLFDGCTSLKGDNGTKFSTSHVDASYARPDRGTAEPGYFSAGLEPIFVCEAPTNIRTTSVTSNSITITWDAPENHMGWLVFWKKASEQNFTAGGGDDKSFTIIDLQPNTIYEILVQGICDLAAGKMSDYSQSIFITTSEEICNTPTNLQVPAANITSSSALVKWNGTANQYFMEYGVVDQTRTYGMVVTGNSNELSELEPNTMYRVRVRSKCSESSVSDYTSWVNFTTLNNVNPCTAPTKFQTSNITQTSLTIRWTKGNPSQTNFIVSYKKASESSYTTRNASNNYLNLSGLAPGTEYNVKIEANCGSGSLSDPLTGSFTTLPGECNYPSNMGIVGQAGSHSLTLTWFPESSATRWRIKWNKKGEFDYEGYANVDWIPYTIENLASNIEYEVQILSRCTETQLSDYSPSYFFRTAADPSSNCNKPTNLRVSNLTTTSVKLIWAPGGSEENWLVEMYQADDPSGRSYSKRSTTEDTFRNLLPETEYVVKVQAKCSEDTYSDDAVIRFTTPSTTEGMEKTPSDSPSRGEKILRDGKLYIIVGDKTYDARGVEIKK